MFRPIASEGGGGGACANPPPQFLAEQLTLSQPGGQIMPTVKCTEYPPGFSDLPTALMFIQFLNSKQILKWIILINLYILLNFVIIIIFIIRFTCFDPKHLIHFSTTVRVPL